MSEETNPGLISGAGYSPGIMEDMNNAVFKSMGKGSYTNQMQDFCLSIDRYNQNVLPGNRECVGLTFITRPKLNLSGPSLMMDRSFASMDTPDINSIGFMVRHLLDTKRARYNAPNVKNSSLIEGRSPFITPLCNGLLGISGFPDKVLQTTTTEGGYFNEDQTFATGGDSLRKTYDLTLNFKDIQYAPVSAIIETWYTWMLLATEGRVVAYGEDIDRSRIPYTCSIYRFVLDPSKRFIMRCSKATGCFPTVGLNGGAFNVNEGATYVDGVNKFSVPFKCNHVMYNDYVIFILFNLLVQKYVGVLGKQMKDKDGKLLSDPMDIYPDLPDDAAANYSGVPYIKSSPHSRTARLVFKDISGSGSASKIYKSSMEDLVEPLDMLLTKKLIDKEVADGKLSPDQAASIIAKQRININSGGSKFNKRAELQRNALRKRMKMENVGEHYV